MNNMERAAQIDVARLKGIGRRTKMLLNAAGFHSVADLANQDPQALAQTLIRTNQQQDIIKNMPSEETLTAWIENARQLPPYLVAIRVGKRMLQADKYEWTAGEGDNPNKTRADAIMFNRNQGYEVQRMIQKVCEAYGFESVEDVQRVERVIAEELPGSVRSQQNVYNWLVEYFDTH